MAGRPSRGWPLMPAVWCDLHPPFHRITPPTPCHRRTSAPVFLPCPASTAATPALRPTSPCPTHRLPLLPTPSWVRPLALGVFAVPLPPPFSPFNCHFLLSSCGSGEPWKRCRGVTDRRRTGEGPGLCEYLTALSPEGGHPLPRHLTAE